MVREARKAFYTNAGRFVGSSHHPATNWYGHEDSILRYVFWHSLALATLMGIFVYLQAYVPPFTALVVK